MNEKFNKILKYLLIGIVTYLSLVNIPDKPYDNNIIGQICITVSISYAILDRVLPSICFKGNDDEEKDD